MRLGRRGEISTGVWIVINDQPDAAESVLGVFATEDEARAFVGACVPSEYASLVYAYYEVGWTFRNGSSEYRSQPG